MNPEQQRIAIAAACGWERETRKRYGGESNVAGWGFNTHLPLGAIGRRFALSPLEFPDYLNDLNAMHEAESTLGDALYDGTWLEWLRIVVERSEGISCNLSQLHRATAAQRAKAFLCTLGKWSDS